MNNSLFYNHIKDNEINRSIINEIEEYASNNPQQQIYLITSPLGEKYKYEYEENVIVILSPRHKIIFIDLKGEQDSFDDFYEDFIEDLSSISDKFNYKEYIGRPRAWKRIATAMEPFSRNYNLDSIFKEHSLEKSNRRLSELLISLLIGSINDIEKVGVKVPETLLDKVKKNIILFDGDQTSFIYKDFPNKTVSIQGLSGTGKTELLLHKLKEIYLTDENSKIFLTCHNIALANTLKTRIPIFFNFMKVEKQIEWNTRLWVDRAWGSQRDINSGLYSYLCDFYKIPFLRYNLSTSYDTIFKQVMDHISKIEEKDFKCAFDYILIDERQDFPKVFFELCKKIVSKKVYIAGDIFQDIFGNTQDTELKVDVILNRCYRTDPRTLMFAHAIGIGLFEKIKLNWFEDDYWEALGYTMTRHSSEVHLSRESIRRFEDLEVENLKSVIIKETTLIPEVLNIIKTLKNEHTTITPNDVAIIVLDDNKEMYNYIDRLCYHISEQIGWKTNRAYESKAKAEDEIYVTNPNNVKGLEFPFVICITGVIQDTYRYRNILYTMLTRSFLQSYLLVQNDKGIDVLKQGLESININKYIKTIEPSIEEKEIIKNKLIGVKEKTNVSYKEFLAVIFEELDIPVSSRSRLEKALMQADILKFDEIKTKKFIEANKEFYC
ncbi:MAG: ATP-binding domain-containing protein [Marinifilaceae bacterium]